MESVGPQEDTQWCTLCSSASAVCKGCFQVLGSIERVFSTSKLNIRVHSIHPEFVCPVQSFYMLIDVPPLGRNFSLIDAPPLGRNFSMCTEINRWV